jgi:uncharacterized membrane protein YcaP (DUF421 family)
MDLAALFRFEVSPLEMIVRGSAIYWFLFLLLRFVLRRDVGSLGIADILLLVMIADASQNAMSGGYQTIADGCVLIATLVAWNYLLDYAAYKSPRVRRLLEPQPLLLVHDGRPMRRNMRRELLTLDDLKSELREQGIDELAQVSKAYMEPDGAISVIRREADPSAAKPRKRSIV